VPPQRECRPIARKPPSDLQDVKLKPRRVAPKAAVASVPATPGTPRKKAVAAGPRKTADAAGPRKTADAAGPRKTADARRAADNLGRVQTVIVESLETDKAEAVVTIDLAGRASFADRMVIATGLSDRQISAMALHLEQKLREAGIKRVQTEGAGGSDWVLIDAGDIVVHLFKPDARALYALEKMWGADLDVPEQG
jgi:ribosome silencing factor RsfS/YbeB/iojap